MGKQSKSSSTTNSTIYGNTTTTNPYITATTNNSGTTTALNKGTALDTIYNFVNKNVESLLDEYLNPNINSAQNQAKSNQFAKELNAKTAQSLENDIINPLSQRNMIRSSQATDLYKNLAKANQQSVDEFINELLTNSQDKTASILNNLLQYYMLGANLVNSGQSQSLATSSGNATRTSATNNSLGNNYNDYLKLASLLSTSL